MVRILMLAAALASLGSCMKPDRNGLPHSMREQGRFSAYASAAGEEEKEEYLGPAVYVTAVSEGEVLLFKDGEICARAPAGDTPERHRARGGHLYSDTVEGHETVIFKDGEELFRYPGEEVIVGFAIRDGDIHTLGQRAGKGFSYRMNGKELFSDPDGRITGSDKLTEWEDGAFSEDLHYAYGIPLGRNGGAYEFHVMQGARTVRIFETSASESVLDIRVMGGDIYIVKLTAGARCELVRNYDTVSGFSISQQSPSGMWIVPFSGGACVKWSGSGAFLFFGNGRTLDIGMASGNGTIPDMLLGGNFVTVADGKVRGVYIQHSPLPIEAGRYTFTSPLCAALIDGEYHVALSDPESGNHLLLTGRSGSIPFHFPGYFTSIRRE